VIRAEAGSPLKVFGQPTDERRICRMIFDELCVLANGDIVCSCGDPSGKLVYGNVHRDPVAAVFDGKTYRAMRSWQLRTEATSWCPVLLQRCGGRVSRPGSGDRPDDRRVRMLQLEPVSHCNLACPACPVTQFAHDPSYRGDRAAILPLATMLDVVDQLPALEKILFYNFGEPFLHPEAIDFLRAVRSRRPGIVLHTSTNGLALTRAKIEAIAAETLLDRIVFSIDGATEKSYRRYRVGGSFARAIESLETLVAAARRHATRDKLDIVWQYILFEWNDSPAEIAAARARAAAIGVPLRFVLTHTQGASQRLTAGAPELREQLGVEDPWTASTCDLRAEALEEAGSLAAGRFAAHLAPSRDGIVARPGGRFAFELAVANRSQEDWNADRADRFRVGVQLRPAIGPGRRDLPSVPIPLPARLAGGSADLLIDGLAPAEPGSYELFLDVVEEGVTWFHERGSAPARIRLEVSADAAAAIYEPAALATELALHLADQPIPAWQLAEWAGLLAAGTPIATLSSWILASVAEANAEVRRKRAHAAICTRLGLRPPP
jgi:pyruvate-formate lyase-activating enzyme